jgi:hypothetical protein
VKKLGTALAGIGLLAVSGTYMPTASADTFSVDFKLDSDQASVRDPKRNDTFNIDLTDSKVKTHFELTCQAGRTALLGLARQDEACTVKGNGSVVGPNGQDYPRTMYKGGFTTQAARNGDTEMNTLLVSYLAIGQIQPSEGKFGGVVGMKPEKPSKGATDMAAALMRQLEKEATGGEKVVVNTAMDTVDLRNFTTPSAGFTTDKGCTWNGTMAFAYATNSWVMDLKAQCGDKSYTLRGNMPWIDVKDAQDHNVKYTIALTVPKDAKGDDAMFTAAADDAMFTAADGLSGTIKMMGTDKVKTEIEPGVFDDVASRLKAWGTITGTNVQPELVRSFAQMMAIFARTFFGA